MKFPKTWENGLTLLSLKDPKWANSEQTSIKVTATFENVGEMPFGATLADSEEHGRDIFEYLSETGEVAEWVRPEVNVGDLQSELDKLWPDVVLGIATNKEMSLAKSLRLQIKVMTR